MKYSCLIPILLCFGSKNEFCQCPPVNKKIVETVKKRNDFICIGEAIEELKTESAFEIPMYWLRVDSVLKGQKKIITIIINQNNAGNCLQYFEIGQKYYIIGNYVAHPKEVYSMTQKEHSKPLEKIINENYAITTDVCRSFNVNSKLVEYFFKD